jgi:hypothetical protein
VKISFFIWVAVWSEYIKKFLIFTIPSKTIGIFQSPLKSFAG